MKTPAWRGFHEHCQHRAPRILRIGGGASRQLPDVLATLGLSRPLIVTDAFLVGQGRVETLQGSLKAAGIASRVFDGTVPDPTVASIEAGLAFLREGDHDCVVGFGGAARSTARRPSPCSRATAEPWPTTRPARAGRTRPARDRHPDHRRHRIGSDPRHRHHRRSHRREDDVPRPCLPARGGAGRLRTDLHQAAPADRRYRDRFADHAIEAYVSKRASPFTDGMALLAMRAIAPNLRRACDDPDDRAAREALMLGATQAGIAFTNASVALVHGMSRPIGAHFHVPHGLSNAMLLPTVTAWSAPAALARYAECARAMGVADAREGDQARWRGCWRNWARSTAISAYRGQPPGASTPPAGRA
jgi:hypothetical protein